MNILVVGGSGHVSGTLARMALRAGCNVWTVTRGRNPLPDAVTSLIADRHEPGAMETAVRDTGVSWDLVVDCICYDVADIEQDISLFSDRTRKFVLVSTDFVYDPALRTFPQPEDTSHYVSGPDGTMEYGKKKRACEETLLASDCGEMQWTVFRPCHIYGPTSHLGCLPYHGRDADLINRLNKGEQLRLVGGGYFLQQPILAEDLAATILSVAHAETAAEVTYNVAGPDVIESWEYYRIIADAIGVEMSVVEHPVREYLEEHPESAPFLCHRTYDLSRLESSGLHVPSTPIADGLMYHVAGLVNRK